MENTVNKDHYTEDQIILAHTNRFLSETQWTKNSFIQRKLVPALVASGFYKPEPSVVDEYDAWVTTQRRYLSNIFTGRVNFPLAWKWVWLSCLPEPYRGACKKELHSLTGSMFIPMPPVSDVRAPAASRLSDLMREFSEVVRDSRPAQDGAFSPDDSPAETQLYADQLVDLLEACFDELMAVQQGTGVMPSRQVKALMMSDFERDHDAGLEDDVTS